MTTPDSARGTYTAVSPGVLAVVAESLLRDEVDRVAAAVGARVVHATASTSQNPVSRKAWAAAAAVVMDEAAANRCSASGLPRRSHVVLVSSAPPAPATWTAAIAIGAQQVLVLPDQERELVGELADAAELARDGRRRGEMIAVVAGRGGGGASVFAAALAQAATDALLIDLDPWGGGIDLLLGAEEAPGVRWPDLTLRSGRLNWPALREALPRRRGVSMLSGTRYAVELEPRPVDAVIDAGRRGGVTVICDLPRRLTDAAQTALETADLVVLLSPCDVRGCAATATLAPVLAAVNPNIGLVVRGPSPGGLRAADVAATTGVSLLASMRAEPRIAEQLEHGGLRLRRRSALTAAARRVLAVLPGRAAVPAPDRAA